MKSNLLIVLLTLLALVTTPVLGDPPIILKGDDVPLYFVAGSLMEQVDRLATRHDRTGYQSFVTGLGYAPEGPEALLFEQAARDTARILTRNPFLTDPSTPDDEFVKHQLEVNRSKVHDFAQVFADFLLRLNELQGPGSIDELRRNLEEGAAASSSSIEIGSTGDEVDRKTLEILNDFGPLVDSIMAESGVNERWYQ